MKVSLIITTYNRPDALTAVLGTVLSQTRPPDEIVVADDGSGKPTREVVRFFQDNPLVPVLHVWQKDQGFRAARIRNMALARASGDYIIFIDGDILLNKHFISDHCRNAKKGFFLQGGRILLSQERTETILNEGAYPAGFSIFFSRKTSDRHKIIHSHLLSTLFSHTDTRSSGARTCNLSVWISDAIDVNGFNEAFHGWGREDSEFVERLFFAGLKRRKLVFNAIGFHLHHPWQSRDALEINDKLLEQTVVSGNPRCEFGVNTHLK